MELESNNMCFAYGKENPIGLHMDFSEHGDAYVSEFTIHENYQGWSGIAHGGILSTVLDEVMAQMLIHRGYLAITAKLEVRFLQPAKVGDVLQLTARLVRERGRALETEAEATTKDGTKIAEAKALSIVSKEAVEARK